MAHSSILGCHHIPIILEWEESLVGLQLIIPSSWWPAYYDDGLNLGRIATINLNELQAYYFQVQLDYDEDLYRMLYGFVLLHVDSDQPGFMQFCLPLCCPGNPDNKMVRVSMPLHQSNMHQSNTHMGSLPRPRCPIGVAKNDVNGANDEDDTNDDSNYYDYFGNLKKKRASTMKKKKKRKTMTKMMMTMTVTKKKGGKRCNNKSWHIKEVTINHNSQLSVEGDMEGDVVGDFVGDVDVYDENFAEGRYKKTKKNN
jgi:hypothetical protein